MEPDAWDKYAENYHDEISSPLREGVKNPLLRELDKIENAKDKIIADIGCGRGEILDILATKFKKVIAMDFSPAMIEVAKKHVSKENVEFYVRDMRELSEFKESFDVIVTVNSVLMPDIRDIKKALNSINDCLKKDGLFYGIFPAMDSILYQGFLIFEEQLKKYDDEKRALKRAKRIIEKRNYDFIKGIYTEGENSQKFYYDFELKLRLKDAGFKYILLSRVLYSWPLNDLGESICFPGKPPVWDWFVSAKK
ncbi:MAG: methyltransferase domain-containing protein [Candidatus Nanoarchaeia archaeon]|nr:methyltransferase domain-containing protein [Candidatus Nanoarchaeia archaeon]